MGKSSKTRRADKRKLLKKATKAAKKALYASYAGTSKKAKKQKVKRGTSAVRGAHVMNNCGNLGCAKCFPQFAIRPKGSQTHLQEPALRAV